MGDSSAYWDNDSAVVAGITAMSHLKPFLDTLDGMVREVESRGFSREQALAMVAYVFGYRPVDGGA